MRPFLDVRGHQRPRGIRDWPPQNRGHSAPGPWRHGEALEFATLAWADWFNTRRLLEPIGYVPPAEYETRYYEQAKMA